MSVAVGVDIGAYKHAVAVCRQGVREAERKALKISANRQGFEELEAWMARQPESVGMVVMESSGHYWFNLASHLRRRGYEVAVVNPLEAKYFAKSRLQRSKSDPADARTLAALGMRDQPRTSDPLVGAELKQASRFAMRLVREQAQACQRIQRLVDIGFPELREAWDDPTCMSALAVLRKAPTAKAVARLRLDTLAKVKRPGDGARAIGPAKAAQLKQLATESVAAPELEAQVTFEMQLLISQYDLYEQQITAAEKNLQNLLDGETARRLLTIPGVGPATAATLIAEIGDIWRFEGRRPAAGLRRRPSLRAELRKEGSQPRDQLDHGQDRERLPAGRRLPDGRRWYPAQPHHPRALRPQARRRQVEDERRRPLHEQVALAGVGCLAGRQGLRPHQPAGPQDLPRRYGI